MPFLRNCWYVVGFPNEFSEAPIRRQVIGDYLAIFRDDEGVVRAVEDRCPHRFVPLSMGKVEGCQIRCGYHGLAFDAKTGACSDRPMDDGPLPPKLKIKAYAVEEKYDIVWAWMGEKEEADPELIPDFSLVSASDHNTITGYLKLEANVQLISDNLLDLSHVQFLHPEIASTGDLSKFQAKVEQDGSTVWQRLFRPNIKPNAFHVKMGGFTSDKVNSVGDVRWNAPGVLLAFTTLVDPEKPDVVVSTPSGHLLTPETEYSTHYFWTTGRNKLTDDKELDAMIEQTITQVFTTQDGPMIEAQQREMGEVTDFLALNPVVLKADAAGIRARRVMQRLLNAERDEKEAQAAE